MISTPKVMISIFWSPLALSVIPGVRVSIKFTPAYFYSDIIPKIIEGMSFDLANPPQQLMLHIGNATSPRARESITCLNTFRICPIEQSPYYPDLVPCDFFRFEKLKDALAGQEFKSTEEFFLAIRESLTLSNGQSWNWFFSGGNGDRVNASR
jgi:hypothetical protein